MVDIILWILIIALFVLSFLGLIFPIIPSVLVIWIGFLLYQFFLGSELNTLFWVAMVVLTVILFVADIIANSYFVKKFGGSKWGERSAAIAVMIGSFIYPPFGLIIVPLLAVFLVELLQRRTWQEATRASVGSLFGFLSGSFAKIIIQLIMIICFFILILF